MSVDEELHELVHDVWSQYPGLTLRQVVERLEEPERSRGRQLVEMLEAQGDAGSGHEGK
jgi:hypothetical protein